MSAADKLGMYADGWTKGDVNIILKAVSESYAFDDPNAGKITKRHFAGYLSSFKDAIRSMRGGSLPTPFMELSEVLTQEKEGILTAWCWWAIPGTQLKGSGLIKVGGDGVRSEIITYYGKRTE
jgi:hypothetical protein